MNWRATQLAFAYMGVIIGGGFASGQEILQFFTGYGWASIAGTLIAGFLFAFLGRQIARMSSEMQAESHKAVLHTLFGPKIGTVMDVLLTFFLYGVGIAMLAGAGALFHQQFGVSALWGGVFMTALILLTLFLNVKRIIELVSAVTPILLAMVLLVTAYSLFTSDAEMADLIALSQEQQTVAPHWGLAAALYAAFNIAVGFPMLAVISGRTRDERTVSKGGVMGGIGLGVLILLINVALLFNLNRLQGAEMPTLALASHIAPWVGWLMTLAITCMIYSTAVGMFFAFSARFTRPETTRFRVFSTVSCGAALLLSLFGFTKLVGTVYPLLGYLGLLLIAAIGFNWYRLRNQARSPQEAINVAPMN